MYQTCAFCNAHLDGDGGPSGLGVGRRIAFDEWRGRLWVICRACGRWNLSPLDDRLERIQAVDLALVVRCPSCGAEGALLTGSDAAQALRRGLTYLNAKRSARRHAELAAREVDQMGGPERLVREVSRREVTLRSLRPERRVALEMAVDELAEITELERQWQEAEEIAAIADGTLSTTPELEEHLRRLKAQAKGDQPNG